MAVSTAHSAINQVDTKAYTLYGYPVPRNVIAIEMRDDLLNDMKVVRWRVANDPDIHQMDLPVVTDETIMAALAAMRLTC